MMSLYLWIKVVHVVAAAIYLGVSLANGFGKTRADQSGEPARIVAALDLVTRQNRAFLVPASAALLVSGVWMAWLSNTPLTEGWLATVLVLFAWLSLLLVAAMWLEERLLTLAREGARPGAAGLPAAYLRMSRVWMGLGIIATAGILAMFAVMTGRMAFF